MISSSAFCFQVGVLGVSTIWDGCSFCSPSESLSNMIDSNCCQGRWCWWESALLQSFFLNFRWGGETTSWGWVTDGFVSGDPETNSMSESSSVLLLHLVCQNQIGELKSSMHVEAWESSSSSAGSSIGMEMSVDLRLLTSGTFLITGLFTDNSSLITDLLSGLAFGTTVSWFE